MTRSRHSRIRDKGGGGGGESRAQGVGDVCGAKVLLREGKGEKGKRGQFEQTRRLLCRRRGGSRRSRISWTFRAGLTGSHSCARNATKGYDACSVHGAGTRKRVKEGRRKSPKTVSVKTGAHAKPETIELKKQLDPAYAHCYNEVLRNPQLATLDEMANRIYASLLALDYEELTLDERGKRLKSLAFAISKVEQTRVAKQVEFEKLQKIFVDALKKVFHEFVPRERLAEASARLGTLIGEVVVVGEPGDGETPRLPGPTSGSNPAVS